ncbi:MAG: M56 family metallopeptidase [Rubrobacteridae bacterium]|nr:M56 family metallopeptidase [Rubrobacteridae bacterium]
MPLLQSVFIEQILPSVFDAAASLLLVFIFSYIFRIKSPQARFALYCAVLVRSFVVLIDNYCTHITAPAKASTVMFGFRVADPFDILSIRDFGGYSVKYNNDALMIAITIAACGIAGFIVLRWVQLFVFLQKLKKEPELDREEYSWLYDIVNNIANSINMKPPRIVQSDRFPVVPFAIGSNKPAIVFSRGLIEKFSKEQLEIMLAHEITHIKRADYINNWFMMILRDAMFFNPLAYFIYRRAEEEKEKICDREVLRIINTNPKRIASLLVDVALFYRAEQLKAINVSPSLTKGFLYNKTTLDRRISSILDSPEVPHITRKRSIVKFCIGFVMFLIISFFQLSFMLKINGIWITLR